MSFHKYLIVFLTILTILMLNAASFATPTVLFWHSMSGHKGKLLHEIIDEWNEKNKNRFEVRLQFIGTYEEGLTKLRAAILARRAPHIVQVTDIGTKLMIDSGAITPLQELINSDPSFPFDQILPQIRRYYEIGGVLYSLPFATSNPILYYNVDALKQAGVNAPPATFDALYQAAKKLTKPIERKTAITWPLHSWFFEQFLARQGQELIDAGNGRYGNSQKAYYTCDAAITFLNLWSKMVFDGLFANVGRGWQPAEQNFLAGRSAMLITSTSDVFEISKKASFSVMTAPIPTHDPKVPGGTIIGGNSLWLIREQSISRGKSGEQSRYAYETIRYMASKDVQKKWHVNTGYFPIRKDAILELEHEGFYKKFPMARTAIDQLLASAQISATQGALMGVFAESRQHIDEAIEQILAKRMTVEKAMDDAKRRTEDSLARYQRFESTVFLNKKVARGNEHGPTEKKR